MSDAPGTLYSDTLSPYVSVRASLVPGRGSTCLILDARDGEMCVADRVGSPRRGRGVGRR